MSGPKTLVSINEFTLFKLLIISIKWIIAAGKVFSNLSGYTWQDLNIFSREIVFDNCKAFVRKLNHSFKVVYAFNVLFSTADKLAIIDW